MRIPASLLLTSLVPTLFVLLVPTLINGQVFHLGNTVKLSIPLYVASLAGLLLIGLPIYITLRKYGRLNLINLSFAGTVTGLVYFIFLNWLLIKALSDAPFTLEPATLIYGLVLGLITAVTFGFVSGVTKH